MAPRGIYPRKAKDSDGGSILPEEARAHIEQGNAEREAAQRAPVGVQYPKGVMVLLTVHKDVYSGVQIADLGDRWAIVVAQRINGE